MPDRENNRPVTADEWSDHISEFAHKWEVGEAEHSAVNDYYNLQRLYGQIGKKSDRINIDITEEANLIPEQHQYLIMERIALLEHAIDQKSGSMPGYGGAYTEMETSFDELISAAKKEAVSKFPNEEEKQTDQVKEIYRESLGYVHQSLYTRQNL